MWDGAEPGPLVAAPAVGFSVEGTIVGDGRRRTGARYTVLDDGEAGEDLVARGTAGHQVLVLEPARHAARTGGRCAGAMSSERAPAFVACSSECGSCCAPWLSAATRSGRSSDAPSIA